MPGMFAILRRKDPSSTIIGTITVWNNAISHELEKSPDSQITCVELTRFQGQGAATSEKNIRRQGVVSLGRALRQLLLHASAGTEPMISWRESTLTHVLQRRLECSKIVVLGSVSQLAKHYEQTLGTLNYLRRLLVKPGETVSSPFRSGDVVDENKMSDENSNGADVGTPSNHLSEYARSPQLLEQIVTDPRQRLARLFKISSPVQGFPEINYAPSEDDYQQIDYMDYDENNGVNNETNPDSTEQNSINQKKSGLVKPPRQVGELYSLRERSPSNPGILEHKTDTLLDPFSIKNTPQHNADGNVLSQTHQHVRGIKRNSPENIQADRLLDPQFSENNLRHEIGAPAHDRIRVDLEGIDDKPGIVEGMVHDSPTLGDYSTNYSTPEELTGDPRIVAMENESNGQPSQTKGDSSRRSGDIMALSCDEYEYVAALDESSSSTLGSGVGYKTMSIGSVIPRADNNTKMSETSSSQDLDTNLWQQDSREAFKVDGRTILDFTVGVLKNEEESLALQHKRHEEDLERLRYQLNQALDEKNHAEEIAEEVISSQTALEQQLLKSRNELSKALGDVDLLRRERVDLLKEQEDFRRKFESMSCSTRESENQKSRHESQRLELQHTIEEIMGERDDLKRNLIDTQHFIGDLNNEKQRINTVLDGLRKEKLGLMVELQEKDRKLLPAKKQIEALTSALEDVEKEKLKIKQLYNQKENEANVLKKQLQNMTIKCEELNTSLMNRDTTVRELQDTIKLVKTSQEKQQSAIRELEQERNRLHEKMILEDNALSTRRKNLVQMNLSAQQMEDEHDRYEKQHRADQGTISALKQELSSEKSRRSFADRQKDKVAVELHGIRKATAKVQTENANLERHNVELLQSLEETKENANRNIVSLRNENQELRSRLGEYTDKLFTCQNEKNDIENVLKRYKDHPEGTRGRLSRRPSFLNLQQILAEDKDKMNTEFVRFRYRANKNLHKVRQRHEKVVRKSEELKSNFVRLEGQVFLLEKENAKLRYHRKKCLDEMRNGRDEIALIGEVEAKPPSIVLRSQNSKSGAHILRLVPELYLTKSSGEFSGRV